MRVRASVAWHVPHTVYDSLHAFGLNTDAACDVCLFVFFAVQYVGQKNTCYAMQRTRNPARWARKNNSRIQCRPLARPSNVRPPSVCMCVCVCVGSSNIAIARCLKFSSNPNTKTGRKPALSHGFCVGMLHGRQLVFFALGAAAVAWRCPPPPSPPPRPPAPNCMCTYKIPSERKSRELCVRDVFD